MTDTEILGKAIQKAQNNGWKPKSVDFVTIIPAGWMQQHDHYKAIIYNHDFAKALWGESRQLTIKEVKATGAKGSLSWGMQTIGWQSHLRDMVVADDPIKYLGENL